ncbi:MAG: PKD domain-containing protein, partial [Microthrixaceae bacterium]
MSVRRMIWPLVGAMALVALACVPPPDEGGGTTTTTLPSGAPSAIASASPSIGDAPLVVQFDSAGSSVGTGTGLTYSWDFGDGGATGSGATTSHVYETVGIFTAQLTMTNSEGSSASAPITITVNQDPSPKFYVKTTGTTGADCGPLAKPCSTISEAQANAVANDIHTVRVAGGIFGPLTLVSNMSIDGGWNQNFTDYGVSEVTTINGTGTSPAVTINGVSNSSLARVSALGLNRTSGDAVGVQISGGSNSITIDEAIVSGGVGPNATGILVTGASNVDINGTTVNSGVTVGAGSSAYGVRVLGQSTANVTFSNVTAGPGIAGTSAPTST